MHRRVKRKAESGLIMPPAVFWAGTACPAKLKAKTDDRPYDYSSITSVGVFRGAGHQASLSFRLRFQLCRTSRPAGRTRLPEKW